VRKENALVSGSLCTFTSVLPTHMQARIAVAYDEVMKYFAEVRAKATSVVRPPPTSDNTVLEGHLWNNALAVCVLGARSVRRESRRGGSATMLADSRAVRRRAPARQGASRHFVLQLCNFCRAACNVAALPAVTALTRCMSAQLLLDVIELTQFSAVPVREKFSLPRLNLIWKQLMSMVAKITSIAAMRTVCSNIVTRYLVCTQQARVGGS
jgi:hypothetical protein